MDICVYGASSEKLERKYYEAAEELGREIAEKGHSLIFGGGREGLMGSCAKSAFHAGAHVTGIAPGFFDIPGVLFKSCGQFILTDTMRERKALMEEKADGFILMPGGIGSFEEFFETLTLKQLGQLNKPIVILNTDGYYEPMLEMLRNTAQQKFMSESCMELFKLAATPAEAVEKLMEKDELQGSVRRLEDYNK